MKLGTVTLVCAALLAFAANSLLARMAMAPNAIDAASFTTLRLCAGALLLGAWVRVQSNAISAESPRPARGWLAPFALFAYATAFSFAYSRIDAGVGALVLFGAVQSTMISWAVFKGERPRVGQWLGLGLALLGLLGLSLPGATAPNLPGVALMMVSGAAWGIYSLVGRGSRSPTSDTSRNFARAALLALPVSLLSLSSLHLSTQGIVLAVIAGALTSGLGYVIWYAALRSLTATTAAIVQLAVPALAALGGAVILDERIHLRLLLSGAAILGGVAVAVTVPR